ncbi:hypothetical protein BBJ28_00003927 [Nothophytophthora sp. Chile5]|nr:hypothetical protein BBJ28_00003927 [Nothophytophthora sp. Chile5]
MVGYGFTIAMERSSATDSKAQLLTWLNGLIPRRAESKRSAADDEADAKTHGIDAREAKGGVASNRAGAKDDDGEGDQPDKSELVNKVIAFFFDDDEFARTFETFAELHCHAFDVNSDEMKLE